MEKESHVQQANLHDSKIFMFQQIKPHPLFSDHLGSVDSRSRHEDMTSTQGPRRRVDLSTGSGAMHNVLEILLRRAQDAMLLVSSSGGSKG